MRKQSELVTCLLADMRNLSDTVRFVRSHFGRSERTYRDCVTFRGQCERIAERIRNMVDDSERISTDKIPPRRMASVRNAVTELERELRGMVPVANQAIYIINSKCLNVLPIAVSLGLNFPGDEWERKPE